MRDKREGGAHQRGGGQDHDAPEDEAGEELRHRVGELPLQRGEDLERAMEPEGEADARHPDQELERPVRPERTADRPPLEQRACQRAAGGEAEEVGEDHHRGARHRRAGQEGDVLLETLLGQQPREAAQRIKREGPAACDAPVFDGHRSSNGHPFSVQKIPAKRTTRELLDRLTQPEPQHDQSEEQAGGHVDQIVLAEDDGARHEEQVDREEGPEVYA